MPTFPYTQWASDLVNQETQIEDGWADAETVLASNSAPDTAFLELGWQGGKIIWLYNNAQVSTLAPSDRERLFPQLAGLFKMAINNALLP